MDSKTFNTPVLLLVFNRPDTTKKVFEIIKKVKPSKLFIAADGPRKEHAEDIKKCEAVKNIFEDVDWKCEVKKLYRDNNLGCKVAVGEAINWFFKNVDQGIVLEDDCVADLSFFRYCDELLNKYKDDQRIMAISGNNFQKSKTITKSSYYFSRYPHCSGWASWKRAWKYYDEKMRLWPEIKKENLLKNVTSDRLMEIYWTRIFDMVYRNKINSWAYRWTFACWLQNGLTILPNKNLVTHIGIGIDATNIKSERDVAVVDANTLKFPLEHPNYVIRESIADSYTDHSHFLNNRILIGLLLRYFLIKTGLKNEWW